jgi:hypothetical protein
MTRPWLRLKNSVFRGLFQHISWRFRTRTTVAVEGRTTLSKEVDKLLHGEAGLLDDGAQDGSRKIPAFVYRNRRRSRRVLLVHQPMMTAGGAHDLEARPFKSAE